MSRSPALTRTTGRSEHVAAGYAELFFDLVYVFAITQLSHYLLAHHDLNGVLQTAVMFFAVWWAWTYMAWATNWLDPERAPVRLMIFAVMLVSLVMSASIPKAFGDRGLWFALAYVSMQIGRTLFTALATRAERPELGHSLIRSTAWFVYSLPLWIAGAFAGPESRLLWWAAALMIEYAGPLAQFYVPGMGRSTTGDYEVTGAHMAERCGLLIIIALGEGILVTGATFAGLGWGPPTVAALVIAFAGSVAMWWIYFDVGMKRGADHISHHRDTGRIARNVYTYAHIPIVAGIVVTAVGDELLLVHPTGHSEPALIASGIGGPAIFLAGTMVFKRITSLRPWLPFSHVIGLILYGLLALAALFAQLAPLTVGGLSASLLLVVAVWEWGSYHGGWEKRGIHGPANLRRRGERLMAEWEEREAKVSSRDDRG